MVDWENVDRLAGTWVGHDGTKAALPFAMPSLAALALSTRKVFICYFPFFLISMDNLPISQDHWTVHYMRRSGEGGKFASAGGFSRERPLPAGPWNTRDWREVDEAIDVLRAKAIGADGFGVGLEAPGTGAALEIPLGVAEAAAHVARGFDVFAEPDGDVLRNVPAESMAEQIKAFDATAATMRRSDRRTLIAPFSPQTETVAYWKDVLSRLQKIDASADFIPVLLNPGKFGPAFAPISVGLSFWGFRDPVMIMSPVGQALVKSMQGLAASFMQPVAPQDFRPKVTVFWESRNTEAFRDAWMQAINEHAPYVQLITWNDYSESTEIGPSSGIQFLFYDLSAYYIAWFKTGKPPRILRDAIYYSYRDQIFDPDHPPRPSDRPYRRLGDTMLTNDIEMLAMLTSPATLEIDIGGRSQHMQAGPGLTAFRVPAMAGRPCFRIVRGGQVLKKLGDWTISAHPDAASALYFGGSSTRAFVSIPDGR